MRLQRASESLAHGSESPEYPLVEFCIKCGYPCLRFLRALNRFIEAGPYPSPFVGTLAAKLVEFSSPRLRCVRELSQVNEPRLRLSPFILTLADKRVALTAKFVEPLVLTTYLVARPLTLSGSVVVHEQRPSFEKRPRGRTRGAPVATTYSFFILAELCDWRPLTARASSDAGVPHPADGVSVSDEGIADELDDVEGSTSRLLVACSGRLRHSPAARCPRASLRRRTS